MRNIIFGNLHIDVQGSISAISHKTGEKIVLNLIPQDNGFFSTVDSYILGEGFNASGKKVLEIVGSWMDQISIKWIEPKKAQEIIWKEEKPID